MQKTKKQTGPVHTTVPGSGRQTERIFRDKMWISGACRQTAAVPLSTAIITHRAHTEKKEPVRALQHTAKLPDQPFLSSETGSRAGQALPETWYKDMVIQSFRICGQTCGSPAGAVR